MNTNTKNSIIISIGDELVSGQIDNSNSVYLANILEKNGIKNTRIITIPDREKPLVDSLDKALGVDYVFITGGLGPTHDDRTKNIVTDYFDTELVEVDELTQDLEEYFKEREINMSPNNYDQALIPRDGEIIPNEIGTASGMHFKKNQTQFFFLPGVPAEMKRMTENYIITQLTDSSQSTFSQKIRTFGIPESKLAQQLQDWIQEYEEIKLSFLPQLPGVDIFVKSQNKKLFEKTINHITDRFKNSIFGFDTIAPAEKLAEVLNKKNWTISVAESCTGGRIVNEITNVPGSSSYFVGGIIAYANQIKKNFLDVDSKTLKKYGAVSSETAEQMSEGIKDSFGTEVGLSTTGIAGPAGGSKRKPLGTVFIGISTPNKTKVEKYIYNKNRLTNKKAFTKSALLKLIKTIQNE